MWLSAGNRTLRVGVGRGEKKHARFALQEEGPSPRVSFRMQISEVLIIRLRFFECDT